MQNIRAPNSREARITNKINLQITIISKDTAAHNNQLILQSHVPVKLLKHNSFKRFKWCQVTQPTK